MTFRCSERCVDRLAGVWKDVKENCKISSPKFPLRCRVPVCLCLTVEDNLVSSPQLPIDRRLLSCFRRRQDLNIPRLHEAGCLSAHIQLILFLICSLTSWPSFSITYYLCALILPPQSHFTFIFYIIILLPASHSPLRPLSFLSPLYTSAVAFTPHCKPRRPTPSTSHPRDRLQTFHTFK